MEDETNVDSKDGTKRGKAGNDSSFSSFGQDWLQTHQDESTTKTKATGGIETDSRTSGDHEQGQHNSQIHQEEDITKDGIGDQMGGNETDTRTSGDHEQGQDNFQLHRDEDNTKDGIGDFKGAATTSMARTTTSSTRIRTTPRFQLHQDENTTNTKATGGIETDTRTSGDHGHSQDNFQLHQDEDNTEDGIGDYKGVATTSKGRTTSSATRMRTTPWRGTR